MVLKNISSIIMLTFVGLFMHSCTTGDLPGHDERKVLAVVGGENIFLDDFQKKFSQQKLDLHAAIGPVASAMHLQKENLLNNYIDEIILLQEARRLHILVKSEEIEKELKRMMSSWEKAEFYQYLAEKDITQDELRDDIKRRLTIAKYIQREVFARIAVTDKEIREYFESHIDDFYEPEKVRARQIYVKTEEQAHEAISAIKNGLSFEEAAMKYSLSPDAHRGGDLGYFPQGTMPPIFDKICFSLKIGKMSPVVSSDYGFHVFQVLDKTPAKALTLKEVVGDIEAEIRRKKERIAYEKLLTNLHNGVTIIINKDYLSLVE